MNEPKPTAAIFNRWLFTLGGGEQVTFAYAEALRDLGYQTTLLTHKHFDLREAEKKMNVHLRDIKIRYLPLVISSKLSSYSQEYDVFINTSYLDYFPNLSKKGILSVFFPGEIYLSFWEYCKRLVILPSFRNFFIYPTHFENFLGDEYKHSDIYKWVGKSSDILFAHNPVKKMSIQLYLPTFAYSTVESLQFKINNEVIKPYKHVHHHSANKLTFFFHSLTPIKRFSINNSLYPSQTVALTKLTIPDIRYFFYNLFKTFFPLWEMRLHGGPGITTSSDLQSYQKIITISKFCQTWIKRYWGMPSTILYPPVKTSAFTPSKTKKNWISHIGRFFVTGHSKKQLELIRVFKEMYDQHLMPKDWELHFIGSVHEGQSHQQYFDNCVQEAVEYPIYFHTSVPFKELKKILADTKIYWHATGLDENPNKQPVLMEHFGITTVEAMASGCVPVVINAGGQPEIITPDSGFIWNTREELKKFTQQIVENEDLRIKLMKNAIARSQYFDINAFKKRFKEIIEH